MLSAVAMTKGKCLNKNLCGTENEGGGVQSDSQLVVNASDCAVTSENRNHFLSIFVQRPARMQCLAWGRSSLTICDMLLLDIYNRKQHITTEQSTYYILYTTVVNVFLESRACAKESVVKPIFFLWDEARKSMLSFLTHQRCPLGPRVPQTARIMCAK